MLGTNSMSAVSFAHSRTRPVRPVRNPAKSASSWTVSCNIARARRSTTSPALVGSTPRRCLLNKGMPISCSNCWIRLLTAEAAMPSTRAASAMLWCSTTEMKTRAVTRSRKRLLRIMLYLAWHAFPTEPIFGYKSAPRTPHYHERPILQVPFFACRAASLSISDCTACAAWSANSLCWVAAAA